MMNSLAILEGRAGPPFSYLARLSPGSRPAQISALKTMSCRFSDIGLGWTSYPWHKLDRIRTMAIRAWLVETYAPATVNRYLSALKGTLKECWRAGLMEDADYRRASDLPSVKSQRLPAGRYLDFKQLTALYGALQHLRRPLRARAIFTLMVGSGLRRSEVVKLRLEDVNLETGELTIREAKGGKDRISWLGPQAMAVVCEYVHAYPEEASEDRMFSITDDGIYKMVRQAGEKAGLGSVTPHDLRRTFVSALLDKGADLSVVRDLAGHLSVQTTVRYDRRGEKSKRKAAALLMVPK